MSTCPCCGELVDYLKECPFTEQLMCKDCIESTKECIGDYIDE